MSEDDKSTVSKKKDEVEEVVLTSATDCEPAVHAVFDSLSCQDFGLGDITVADDEYIQEYNREMDERAELQQMLENHLN